MTFNDKYCRAHGWEGLSHEHCPECERLRAQSPYSGLTNIRVSFPLGQLSNFPVSDFDESYLDIVVALENLLEAWDEHQNPEDGVAQDAREALADHQAASKPETQSLPEIANTCPREALSAALNALGIGENLGLWRERFEAWASLYPWFVAGEDPKERDDVDYVYADPATDIAWLAWLQATRTAGKYYAYT